VKSFEQKVEGIPPDLVGYVSPVAPLQGVRLEEAAVQERQLAESGCRPTPAESRLIEGAKEQGP
jgi:hypothetical protein